MKKLTIGAETLLVGDAIADAIVEYAVTLSENGDADQVDVTDAASGTIVTVVLSAGVPVTARPVHCIDLAEPDDTEALAYIETRLALRVDDAPVVPIDTAAERTVLDVERWMSDPDDLPRPDTSSPDP